MSGRKCASVAAALAVALSVGCTEGVETPNGPTSVTVIEGSWRLQDMTLTGGSARTPPSADRFTLAIAGDTVQARADCNTCAGRGTLAGTAFTVGPLACTRAACASAPFDTQFVGLLDGTSTVAVDATRLWLTSPRGTLRFVR